MKPNRGGFTLLEMLAVILIIAILVALAFPAYNAVMTNARLTVARTEIASLESAIADFKSKFGMEPPSYINLAVPFSPSTKAVLRKMFPQIDYTADSNTNGTPDIYESAATAGISGKDFKGSESLVFFLGGLPTFNDTNANGVKDPSETFTKDLVGFSKNPANPFVVVAHNTGNRLGPYFEFDSGRLIDNDTDTVWEYQGNLPGQSLPILYLSTARTGSYVATDVENVPAGWTPYQKSPKSYWQPSSYQIIYAGFDNDYGKGGVFDPANTSALTQGDQDNLTNFFGGRLGG